MLGDHARVDASARAIARCVRPGDAVAEIGTGTGLFSLLACRAGARRVYAIEADDIIEVARDNARANGLADSIVYLHAMSLDVTLPERVEVIVSDLRGILPLFENHLGSIADARRRFLAPGGRLIPQGDRIMVACVEAPQEHARIAGPWNGTVVGVELPAARALVLNDLTKERFEPRQLATEPACWAVLDYAAVEADAGLSGQLRLRATRDATAHGIAAWFEATLTEGIEYSSAPGQRDSIYGNAFFPWPTAVALAAGEEVEVSLQARRIAGDYVWSWETRCASAHFRQSTFDADVLSASSLRRREASHVPQVGEEARIDHLILGEMQRRVALGAIAREVSSRYPERFPRWEDAMARVGELSVKYGRAGWPTA
jgi:protein arginine N-methyltransferase 1